MEVPDEISNEPIEIIRQRKKALEEVVKLQDMLIEELRRRRK